jgi:hypothetical protein
LNYLRIEQGLLVPVILLEDLEVVSLMVLRVVLLTVL